MPNETPTLSATGLLTHSLRSTITSPSLWKPALVLLLPTLVLQLIAPTYLRTRLSPSPWFVVAGSLALVLMAQLVTPAIFAMVHARRAGAAAPPLGPTLTISARAGARSFVGLLLGVIPGLWLQARYAFVAIPLEAVGVDGLATSAAVTRGRMGRLMMCGAAALVASILGQSLVAVLNDALALVSAAGAIDGRTVFELHYGRYVVTTLIAYGCVAGATTLHAVGASLIYGTVDGAVLEPVAIARAATVGRGRTSRIAVAASLGVLVAGLAAMLYKIQQHVL